ncbi:hypothetical protein B296_00043935, partial [Ensete ventricosum]
HGLGFATLYNDVAAPSLLSNNYQFYFSLVPNLGGRNPYSVPRVNPPQGSKSIELLLGFFHILATESHKLHLHGYNFFIVEQGFDNYGQVNDPTKFNLVDPMERNTIGTLIGGLVVIKFLVDNPVLCQPECMFSFSKVSGTDEKFL